MSNMILYYIARGTDDNFTPITLNIQDLPKPGILCIRFHYEEDL